MTDYQVKAKYDGGTEISIYHTEFPQPEAELASKLLLDHGVELNTDTSALLKKCFDTAEAFFQEARRRKLMLQLPAPKLSKKETLGEGDG